MSTETTVREQSGLDLDINSAFGLPPAAAQQLSAAAGAPAPASPVLDKMDAQSAQVEDVLARMSEQAQTAGALVPTTDGTLDVPESGRLLSCRDMLSEDKRTAAIAFARQSYPGLVRDPNTLSDFGRQAVAPVNKLVDDMLAAAGRSANIPEIVQITHALDDSIRNLTVKYDPDVLKDATGSYLKAKSKISRFFNKYRKMLQMLIRDAQTISTYFKKLDGQLDGFRAQLSANVADCNKLYKANEEAIGQLVVVIAVMEYVRDLAADDAKVLRDQIKAEPSAANAREKTEALQRLLEFIMAIDVRIGEFQQRYFIAVATSPQIRNIRFISYNLNQRLALLQILTVPTFKLAIVQWIMLEQGKQAGKVVENTALATEAALRAFSGAAKNIVAITSKQIMTPSTSPETIHAVALSLADQAKGITDAYKYGVGARRAISAHIVQGAEMIRRAEALKTEEVLALVRQSRQLELGTAPAMPQVPDYVAYKAGEVLGG